MAHLSQSDLTTRLEQAANQVTVGAYYTHYKNAEQTYVATDLVILEASDEVGVVYQANYGDRITFVRPLISWLELVEVNGQTMPRFSSVRN